MYIRKLLIRSGYTQDTYRIHVFQDTYILYVLYMYSEQDTPGYVLRVTRTKFKGRGTGGRLTLVSTSIHLYNLEK